MSGSPEPDRPCGCGSPETRAAAQAYPIHTRSETFVARRGLLKWSFAGTAGLLLASLFPFRRSASAVAPQPFRACSLEELEPGTSLVLRDPVEGNPCIVIRDPKGEVRAYDQRCSHLMCPVLYNAEKNRIDCPCHRGAFKVGDGTPIHGPTRKPLRAYAVTVAGKNVTLLRDASSPGSSPA